MTNDDKIDNDFFLAPSEQSLAGSFVTHEKLTNENEEMADCQRGCGGGCGRG